MGNRAFRRIQISDIESSAPGTAEAATEVLHGILTFQEVPAHHQPNEDRNSLALHMANDEFVGTEVHLTLDSDLNARQAIYAAGSAIRGNITATQPDSTNEPLSYLWSYEMGYTTANTPDITNGIDTFTVEYGDDTQAYETEYCFAQRWVISGTANEPIHSTLEWVGRQRTDTTFTASLSAPSIQRMPFNKTLFYIDTAWATMAATPTVKTATLRSFSWEFDTGFRAFYTADGALYFSRVSETKKAPVLTMTYVWNATSDAERTKFEGRTTTFIRLKMVGQTEQDASQSNPPYVAINGAYRYRTWPEWSEDQGLGTVQVVADGVYDATGAHMFTMDILNTLSDYAT